MGTALGEDHAYHRKVRAWVIDKFGDTKHAHMDPNYLYNRQSTDVPFSECFNMRNSEITVWDFEFQYYEGGQIGDYTWESSECGLYVRVPLEGCSMVGGSGVFNIPIADREELATGKFSFAAILRELLAYQ